VYLLAHMHTQATLCCPRAAGLSKPIGTEKVAVVLCVELSHSLVGHGTRRLGSPSCRHTNNESSSVSEIALLSLKVPKALYVCPSVKKTLTAGKKVLRLKLHMRICRRQIPRARGGTRIRATAARSWGLSGRDTKIMSIHFLPHSKHTAFGSS
jgi:hypothetical protein